MLTKKINFNPRRAWAALAAAALCLAPAASGNDAFPQPSFSDSEIREFERLCREAGHDSAEMTTQYFGSEYCEPVNACVFFGSEESPWANPSPDGATGCLFRWGIYDANSQTHRFGSIFNTRGCLPDSVLKDESRDWDTCAETIPECGESQVRMLDGQETDNPFAPCVDKPSANFDSEVQELSRLCREAGHEPEQMWQQYFGTNSCHSMWACRFAPDVNPSPEGRTGCMFSWSDYVPRATSFRFGYMFQSDDEQSSWRCQRKNVLRGEENSWDICENTIPECGDGEVRMLDGKESNNLFAPCVDPSKDPTVNDQNRAGRTKLHLAIIEGRYDEVDGLFASGADPNIQDRRGATPLHYAAAASEGDADGVIKRLLEGGADPNFQDRRGDTPLHTAAANSAEAVQAMLDGGADPRIRNRRGQTPLEVATDAGKKDAAEILTKATR